MRARITRVGRWRHEIRIINIILGGLQSTTEPPWHAYGRRRAERKARRILARYQRDAQRRADVREVEL